MVVNGTSRHPGAVTNLAREGAVPLWACGTPSRARSPARFTEIPERPTPLTSSQSCCQCSSRGRFDVDEEDFLAATTNQRSFNLVDEVELAKVDIFCVTAEGHAGAALDRSVRLPLQRDDPFSEVNVSSPEDSIISKLRWYRQGNEASDRQWSDVLNVLSVKRETLDLLERALRQSN